MKYNFWTAQGKKGKIWDNPDYLIGKNVKRINENLWFKQQQKLLLWMANTDYGRDLLCIPKNFPKIIEMSKKHITGLVDITKNRNDTYKIIKVSDFRTGTKWANVIRYRWKEFQEYAKFYYMQFDRLPVFYPVVPVNFRFAYTTSTFYPNPGDTTAPTDGILARDLGAGNGSTWNDIRNGAGNQAYMPSTTDVSPALAKDASGWWRMRRQLFGFNTSSIGTDTISSGTLSLTDYSTSGPKDDFGGGNSEITFDAWADMNNEANFDAADYNDYDGVEQVTARMTYNNFQSGNTYKDFTLNSSGISSIKKNGNTFFGARTGYDFDNSEPGGTGTTQFKMYMSDETGTSKDPKLVVTHTAAAVTIPSTLSLLGVGS